MIEPNKTPSRPCDRLEADLVLYHYGDLEGAERAALQAHLKNCAGCAQYLVELGTLLPLTIKTDQPPTPFWTDYDRELRRKLDGAAEQGNWRTRLAAFFQPRLVPVLAATAVIALALTFTLGKGLRSSRNVPEDNAALLEVLPVAENLEFFKAMEVLDNLDLLESMGGQGSAA